MSVSTMPANGAAAVQQPQAPQQTQAAQPQAAQQSVQYNAQASTQAQPQQAQQVAGTPASADGSGTGSGSGSSSATGGAAGTNSLYVGDLDKSVTEAQLYEIFSTVGPVVSIRVCRDQQTRRSLGYAYVNFQQTSDAGRAMEVLNFYSINGRAIRISPRQRDPSKRLSSVGNVIVQNLDPSIDNKTLHDTFSQFGTITSAKVEEDSKGNSRGFGYVNFSDSAAAQSAIDNVNGCEIAGKTVTVVQHKRKSDRHGSSQNFTNIFVKNLPDDWDDSKLEEVFKQYGRITSLKVARYDDGRSKCHGFVNFEAPESARSAIDNEDGREEGSKQLTVTRFQPKAERDREIKQKKDKEKRERDERTQGRNLYVRNLSPDVDDERLRQLFEEFGTVQSARVMRDQETGASKQHGFVLFSTSEEAMKAVTEMNAKIVNDKPLYVTLYQKKEERQRMMQQQFNAANTFMASPGAGQMPGGMMPQGYMPAGMMPTAPAQTAMPAAGMQAASMQMMAPNMRPPAQMMQPGQYYMQPQGGQPQRGGRGGRGGRGRGQQGPRSGMRGGPGRGGMDPSGTMMMHPEQAAQAADGQQFQQQPQYTAAAAVGQQRMATQQQATPVSPQVPTAAQPGVARQQQSPQQQQSAATQQQHQQQQQKDTARELASRLANMNSTEEQQRLLGESLFPLVEQVTSNHRAPKITGMLLEGLELQEVLNLIETPEALREKVQEAIQVLEQAGQDE